MIPFPNISPEIFTLSFGAFSFSLRWYAMAYIVGLLLGWWGIARLISTPALWRTAAPMGRKDLDDLLNFIVIGIILGGRLGYVLFYNPAYYMAHPLEILKLWQGGMSFHGGFLGVVLAVAWFCQRRSLPVWSVADCLAIVAPIGLLLGRVSNFINAELWGRPTDLPWGVVFPGAAAQQCPEVIGLCARHPSQLYEALLEGVILGAVLLFLAYRRHLLWFPARATGIFLIGYGAARGLVELVRQPDAQFVTFDNPIGYAWHWGELGLTMGQILSLPMIAVGVALILWSRAAGARA